MAQAPAITHKDLMLATSADKPFDRARWVWEAKYDGFRALVLRDANGVRLLSRRGNNLAGSFPELVACVMDLHVTSTQNNASEKLLPELALDSELVMLAGDGKPDFERLCRRALLKKRITVENAAKVEPAVLFAFDALVIGRKDLRKLPLIKRKEALQSVLGTSQRVRPVQYIGEGGTRLYAAVCGLGLEGVVGKRADSRYKAGRSGDWIKVRTPAGKSVQEKRSEQWDQ
jgi:ATP-dependent DNA ligase